MIKINNNLPIKSKVLLLTSLLATVQLSSTAQHFDKKLLDEKVKAIDSSFKFRETLYVINGIPFSNADSLKIDSVLSENGLKYLVNIDILKEASSHIIHSNKVVLVTFAYNQDDKTKRSLLRKLQHRFTDNYVSFSQHILRDAKDPVLYVDNELVHHTEAKRRIRLLTLKNTYYIDFKNEPVSVIYYGQNAKNGLVRIWTKRD